MFNYTQTSVVDPDPHHIERQDQNPLQRDKLYPDPDKSDKLDPSQFADDKPNCMENEPI